MAVLRGSSEHCALSRSAGWGGGGGIRNRSDPRKPARKSANVELTTITPSSLQHSEKAADFS